MATKLLLISLGWASVVLGTLGIFLPLLPTVPFLLLAGWCFARSSQRFHQWLLSHPHFGDVVRNWEQNGSLTPKVRNRALITLWIGMFVSMWIIGEEWSYALLLIIGLSTSLYLITRPLSD